MQIESCVNKTALPENKTLENRTKLSDTIKQVARDNLKVLAAAIALTALTIPFLAGPATFATLLLINVSLVAFSVLFQIATKPSQNAVFKAVPAGIFSFVDTNTRDVVVHEAGHAWMATKVYQNARPCIEIYPGQGGQTSYYPQKLTSWGQSLGARKGKIMVAAAGPAAAILWHCGGLIAAHKLDKSHPEVSRYLRASAIMSIANHALYALSALWASSKDLGHDFLALWRGGIHPLVSFSTIIALPLIVQSGLILSSKVSIFNQFGYK